MTRQRRIKRPAGQGVVNCGGEREVAVRRAAAPSSRCHPSGTPETARPCSTALAGTKPIRQDGVGRLLRSVAGCAVHPALNSRPRAEAVRTGRTSSVWQQPPRAASRAKVRSTDSPRCSRRIPSAIPRTAAGTGRRISYPLTEHPAPFPLLASAGRHISIHLKTNREVDQICGRDYCSARNNRLHEALYTFRLQVYSIHRTTMYSRFERGETA